MTDLYIVFTLKMKSLSKSTIFGLKNDGEKWSRKNYFEIPWWPSEIPANLPGQFSLSGHIFMHWAAATLKRLSEFQNKVLDHFTIIFKQKCQFQDSDFSPLIKIVLAVVI